VKSPSWRPNRQDSPVAIKPDTDARYRSLLQKAVRRGHVDLVYTVSAYIESLGTNYKDWYRTRTVTITFEECWPLGRDLNFNRKFHSKAAALIKVTRAQKKRDACGLADLANALNEGDSSVYNGTPTDKDIKIIANAIRRPDAFWQWISAQRDTTRDNALIERALRFRNEVLRREQAVLQAAAYLALSSDFRPNREPRPPEETFPYWVVFDQHTPEGELTLRDVARDLHIQLPLLEWACFYYEGSKTNGEEPSGWWKRRCDWQFQKLGLRSEEAHLLWGPASRHVTDALAADSRRLKNELYRWKVSNLKRVESLKRQVDLFIEHFEEVRWDQKELFD
jgi:hypothetical protein